MHSGIRLPQPGYLQALRQHCNQVGALLIFDEIQVAFGRTGKLFCFEHDGVVPDVLVLAKALGGGMPLGAFVSSNQIMGSLTHNPILGHITTFGGHPVCCAAGLAAFNQLLSLNLCAQVAAKEALFKKLLVHPQIKEVRGKGLILAAEVHSFDYLQKVIARCIQHGVIIDWFLHCDNSMRIAPPLIITHEQIEQACAVILEALTYCAQ